jgi:hypothetical protein
MSRLPSLYRVDRTAVRSDRHTPDLRRLKSNVFVRGPDRSFGFYVDQVGFNAVADAISAPMTDGLPLPRRMAARFSRCPFPSPAPRMGSHLGHDTQISFITAVPSPDLFPAANERLNLTGNSHSVWDRRTGALQRDL